ncbi:MAG: YceI family protein [Flavobacteriales bacterium]|nr:YceI family protein [Flavobacteriales bacterium]
MKKIKYLSLAALLVAGLSSCSNSGHEEASHEAATHEESNHGAETAGGTYAVDIAKSTVAWKGTMVGMYSHEGTINITEGSITTANGAVTGGSFTIDAGSIATTDDDALYAMAPREDLEGHLKSDDFLGAASNPTGSFTITSVDGSTVTGNLSLKGKTNEEVFTDVSVSEANGSVTISGALTFDRQKYGISFQKGGDMIVSDDIELTISLAGTAN